MTTQAPPTPIPGKIGKYEVVRVLGRGSMGVVYLARDPLIDREVAIKTISLPEGLDDYKVREFRERFLREARAAGRLNHPAIVTVYEADDGSAGGPPFIAMEYVEGLPWNYKIRQKILPDPEAVLPLIRDIASALEYAHRNGVVHRDIKPANIVQTPGGHVKLMDFGIAKVPTSELTREGQFLGTPAYMSPEQIQGQPVDGRADLFSLGTVLYELLTCQKPFPGDDITTVTYRILKEEPPAAAGFNAALDPPVEQMLRRLLAKEPARRYQSATEVMQDIDAYMAGAALPHAGTEEGPPAPKPAAAEAAPRPVASVEAPKAPPPGAPPRPAPPAPAAVESTQTSTGAKKRPSAFLLWSLAGLLLVSVAVLIAAFVWYRSTGASQAAGDGGLAPAVSGPSQDGGSAADAASGAAAPAQPPEDAAPAAQEPPKEQPRPRPKPKAPPKPPEDVLAAAEAIRQAEAEAKAKADAARKAPESAPAPASVAYTFRSGIVKGEFWIRVDGKEVVHEVIHRKFSFKQETYTGGFQIPPGTHVVSFQVRTELQDITGTHQESVTVQPGQKRGLTIVMTKFNKDLRFEWTG